MHNNQSLAALIILALGMDACITSPYDGQRVSDPADPIAVSGFLAVPGAVALIEVYNPSNSTWETIGTATSESTPSVERGVWGSSPELYHFAADVRVYDPNQPQTLARWGGSAHATQLRARLNDYVLLGGGADSTSCMVDRASAANNFDTTLGLCGFRQGPVRLSYVELSTLPVLPDTVFLSPEVFESRLGLMLGGTRFQISQTERGEPLLLPGSGTPAMSYVDFNEELNKMGVADRTFDVPVENQALGELVMGAIVALTGGFFTAHQIRLKINNLNSTLGVSTLEATLEDGAFVLDIELSHEDPAIKCEADTLSFLPFGIPIPVGWRDETCPDAQFIEPHLRLRFVPGVDPNGSITIDDATVTLDTEIKVWPIDFLEEHLKFKQRIKEGFESQLRDKLLAPDFRAGLGTALTRLFQAQREKPIDKVLSLRVDPTGMVIEVPRR